MRAGPEARRYNPDVSTRGNPRGRRSRRERLAAFGLGVAAVVALLGLAEGGVRLAWEEPRDPYPMFYGPADDPVFTYDPVLFWRQKPNTVRPDVDMYTNSLGLRDDEFPPAGGPPAFSALSMGDSVTWGDGVHAEEAYPSVLERMVVDRHPGTSASFLNAGVGGYSTTQALELERQLLGRFRFDLVTIGCLHGDNLLAFRGDREYALSPLQVALLRPLLHSWLFRHARRLLARGEGGGEPAYSPEMVPRVPAEPDYERNLTEMVEMAQRAGAEVLLLCFFPTQLDDLGTANTLHMPKDELRAYMRRMEESEPAYREAMARAASSTGVTLVDSGEVLAGVSEPSRLYVDQVHPTADGHRRIAEHVYPHVEPMLP